MRPPTASTLHTSKHKCAMGVQNYLFNVSLAREIPKKFPIYTLLHTMGKNMGAASGGVLWQYINIFLTITVPYEALHLFLHYLLEVKRGVMSMIFIIFVQDINSQQ